jgi:hypothetical protein
VTTWIRGSICVLALALGLRGVWAQTGTPWQDDWLLRFNQERGRASGCRRSAPPRC